MKKILCGLLSILLCSCIFAGCTVHSGTPTESFSGEAVISQNNSISAESSAASCGNADGAEQAPTPTALPEAAGIHRAVTAQETFAVLSGMDKKAGCDYIYNQYIHPAERAGLLGSSWYDCGADQYIFYYFANVVFHDLEFYRENFPAGKGTNTICIPEDTVENYINQFILEADNVLLRSEEFNSYYNEDQKGYDFFVAETSRLTDSTCVTDYNIDEKKLVVTYDILPIDNGEVIPMTAVFNTEDGVYKLYRTFAYAPQEPFLPSSDGTHTIVTKYTGFRGESSEVHIVDNRTGESNFVDTFLFTNVHDVGFFANGDIYVMDYTGLRVFNFEINMNSKEPLFTTETNFPAGGVIRDDGTERYLFAVRRDPEKFDYIVVYGEYIEDDDYYTAHPNDFQLAYTYKIGLLDKEGKLTQSWDTGVPIMFTVFGFEDVTITMCSENEIAISAPYKGETRFEGRFDLSTGMYTSVKEFKVP